MMDLLSMLTSGPMLAAPKEQKCCRCSETKPIHKFERVPKARTGVNDRVKKVCMDCDAKPKQDKRKNEYISKRERIMGTN